MVLARPSGSALALQDELVFEVTPFLAGIMAQVASHDCDADAKVHLLEKAMGRACPVFVGDDVVSEVTLEDFAEKMSAWRRAVVGSQEVMLGERLVAHWKAAVLRVDPEVHGRVKSGRREKHAGTCGIDHSWYVSVDNGAAGKGDWCWLEFCYVPLAGLVDKSRGVFGGFSVFMLLERGTDRWTVRSMAAARGEAGRKLSPFSAEAGTTLDAEGLPERLLGEVFLRPGSLSYW
jgi:hypothetical protein